MSITIGDKTIEAKVTEEDTANNIFDDAMAGGNFAAMVKDSRENVDLHQMDIGNLNPGQKAKIEFMLIQPLKVDSGAFDFNLPLSYFPKYKNSAEQVPGDDPLILFNFSAQIKSDSPFKQICHPENFEIVENSKTDVVVKKENGDLTTITKDIQVKFKTLAKSTSQYVYQRNEEEYPGKVAVMAQFMPTFAEEQTTTAGDIEFTTDVDDLEEEDVKKELEHKNCFVFIVDRSGSMTCGIRMDMAREALQLFMQSLPTGSKFKIISFGSHFEEMSINGATLLDYNDANRKAAISQIDSFSANFGGTEIYNPI